MQVLLLKDEECQIVWHCISEVLYKLEVMVTSNKWQHLWLYLITMRLIHRLLKNCYTTEWG